MNIEQDAVVPHMIANVIDRVLGPSRGARRRVVYFMRAIDCPISRAHVERLATLVPVLAARDAEVYVVAPGQPRDLQPAWTGHLPFPVAMSSELFAATGYGRTLGAIRKSGTLVIDSDGGALLLRRTVLPFQSFDEYELLTRLHEGRVAA